ncbi:MAG TPA: beta-ketoacyl-[acyl-carrier-protein] synthase family protein [Steroidobacteraceae bacterium]|nr:beta-ketoacyl-[acyl-carrier-protein] synthase family protein [Steroidobacteraceae bacterium]
MRRVAVTGIGVVSPLGNSAEQLIANAVAGRSAVRVLEQPWCRRLAAPLAATATFNADEHFDPPRLRMLDRVSQFALVAARDAIDHARLDVGNQDPQRIGVFVGSGMGGSLSNDEGYRTLYQEQSDRIKPFTILTGMTNAAAAWIGTEFHITGPNLTYSTACSSSAVAIGEAWNRLRHGELDVAFAGGAEAPLSFGSLKAWEALHTLATVDAADAATSCKPFSADRSGMVLGEGAAIVVLEEWAHAISRGATIHGELIGYGLVTDVAHITRPSVAGQAAALQAALTAAACIPASIDCINAHATGTLANDAVETAAIKQVFGEHAYHTPISATKAIHGHLLGASGALEFVLCLLSMQRKVLLPTMHLQQPAPDCDLDYVPNCARHDTEVRTILSSSFAFGGTNAVLVARYADPQGFT